MVFVVVVCVVAAVVIVVVPAVVVVAFATVEIEVDDVPDADDPHPTAAISSRTHKRTANPLTFAG